MASRLLTRWMFKTSLSSNVCSSRYDSATSEGLPRILAPIRDSAVLVCLICCGEATYRR